MAHRLPFHWAGEGTPPQLLDVKLGTEEGAAITNYFLEWMPHGTELISIERQENKCMHMQFDAWKESVLLQLGPEWSREGVESWLFHGTDSVDAILNQGFKMSTVNLSHNRLGAGVYFARDPRLAHHYVRRQRNKHGDDPSAFKMILARVVVGMCTAKKAVHGEEALKLQQHREPPPGCHSVTSEELPGREIVTYPGSPGTPAYPAYVLTYKTQLDKNPYRDLTLATMSLGRDRADAHVFVRYKQARYRPGWSCQSDSSGNPQDFEAGPASSAAPAPTRARPADTAGNPKRRRATAPGREALGGSLAPLQLPPGPGWTRYQDAGVLWWYYEGPYGRWWCQEGRPGEPDPGSLAPFDDVPADTAQAPPAQPAQACSSSSTATRAAARQASRSAQAASSSSIEMRLRTRMRELLARGMQAEAQASQACSSGSSATRFGQRPPSSCVGTSGLPAPPPAPARPSGLPAPPGLPPGPGWVRYQDDGVLWWYYEGPCGRWWCQEHRPGEPDAGSLAPFDD